MTAALFSVCPALSYSTSACSAILNTVSNSNMAEAYAGSGHMLTPKHIVALCESSCQYGSLKRSLKHRDMQEGQEHAQDEERRQRVS